MIISCPQTLSLHVARSWGVFHYSPQLVGGWLILRPELVSLLPPDGTVLDNVVDRLFCFCTTTESRVHDAKSLQVWLQATVSCQMAVDVQGVFPTTRSIPCCGVVVCVSQWPWELCQPEHKLLVGPPTLERSKGRGQTNLDHLSARLRGWDRANNSWPEQLLICHRNVEDQTKRTGLGCGGASILMEYDAWRCSTLYTHPVLLGLSPGPCTSSAPCRPLSQRLQPQAAHNLEKEISGSVTGYFLSCIHNINMTENSRTMQILCE